MGACRVLSCPRSSKCGMQPLAGLGSGASSTPAVRFESATRQAHNIKPKKTDYKLAGAWQSPGSWTSLALALGGSHTLMIPANVA